MCFLFLRTLTFQLDLPDLHAAPVAANDGLPNFRSGLALLMELFCKEDLLDANESTGAVVGGVTVKQAPVPKLVAVAVAGLLRDDFGDLCGHAIRLGHDRIILKVGSRQ